jgi:hypothetical protein
MALATRYRIKSTQPFPEWKLIKECLTDVSIGHLVVRPIVLFAGFDLFKAAGIGIDVPLPGLWTVAWQVDARSIAKLTG